MTDAAPAASPSSSAGRPAGKRSPIAWLLDPYVQIAIGSVLVTASELLMKKGADSALHFAGGVALFGIAALASGWTWLGIITYVLSFVSWIHVLRFLPLGIAYALINVVHVLIPVGSWVFLHERVSMQRWCGIAIVLLGIYLVIRPLSKLEEKL